MISKHIDLIAVAALLLAIALFTRASHLASLGLGPAGSLRMHAGKAIMVVPPNPPAPAIPPIAFVRD